MHDVATTGQLYTRRHLQLLRIAHGAVILLVNLTVATTFFQTWQTLICIFYTQTLVTTWKFLITGNFLTFNTFFFIANYFTGCDWLFTEFTLFGGFRFSEFFTRVAQVIIYLLAFSALQCATRYATKPIHSKVLCGLFRQLNIIVIFTQIVNDSWLILIS